VQPAIESLARVDDDARESRSAGSEHGGVDETDRDALRTEDA
jgi:hypothetical protein